MKRRCVLLMGGMLLLPGVPCAAAQVTLYGYLDTGITYVSNQGGHSNTFMDTGNFVPNLVGFRGSEDLGAGTSAIFTLENQFDLANGNTVPGARSLFSRQAWVGLSNNDWGRLTFGNQYDFMFDSLLFGGFHDANGGFDGALPYGGFYNFRQGPFSALGIPNNPTGSADFDRVAGSARVPGSVKYQSANFAGLTFGALYGFGGVAGSLSAGNTVSLGANYSSGQFAAGAAYTDVRYPQMSNGQDGIRNFGAGMRYSFGPVMASVLYTHTENTQTQARIHVGQLGANWSLAPAWTLGGNVQYMKGNAILQSNNAVQLTSTLIYRFSKRTAVYAEGVYQRASGNGPATGAWINGLFGPSAASSGRTQVLGRMGITSAF